MEVQEITLQDIGKAFARAGSFCMMQAKRAIDKIDVDVKRHLVQLPLMSYSLFKFGSNDIKPKQSDGHMPLIFVHGLGGSGNDFLPMAFFLAMRGRKRSYRIDFAGTETLEEMALLLSKYIKEVIEITGEEKVDLVCHSLGGLVGRIAIHEYGCMNLVNSYISLGSPHKGVFLARLANTNVTNDLRIGSSLIRRINKKSWPKSIRGVCFYSHNDIFIQPPESAIIKGCETIDLSPFTHYSYLLNSKCWEIVGEILCDKHVLCGSNNRALSWLSLNKSG